jgi:hypothetical protein
LKLAGTIYSESLEERRKDKGLSYYDQKKQLIQIKHNNDDDDDDAIKYNIHPSIVECRIKT